MPIVQAVAVISHAALAKVAVEAAAKVSEQLPVYTIGEGDGQIKLPTIEYALGGYNSTSISC